MKQTKAKVLWLKKVGMLKTQAPPELPTKCPKIALRLSGGPSQESPEAPFEIATQHQDVYTGTFGKAGVSSAG